MSIYSKVRLAQSAERVTVIFRESSQGQWFDPINERIHHV
jgi:hypothetical protein